MEHRRMTELRSVRRAKDLTQQALADRAGVSRWAIASAEGGYHAPNLSTMMKLARALGVPLSEISPKTDEAQGELSIDDFLGADQSSYKWLTLIHEALEMDEDAQAKIVETCDEELRRLERKLQDDVYPAAQYDEDVAPFAYRLVQVRALREFANSWAWTLPRAKGISAAQAASKPVT